MDKPENPMMQTTTDRRPIPDPTLLTTQQLISAIGSLKELVFTRLDGMDRAIELFNANITRVPTDTDKQISHLKALHESRFEEASNEVQSLHSIVDARFDGMDKAIRLLQDISDKFTIRIDEKITSLKEIHEEKFSSIQVQFKERDVRAEQSSKDNKVAVDAALQAAKEAVGEQNKSSTLSIAKSEASTIKQIDQMSLLIQTGNKAIDDKFDDIKERLTRIEGEGKGKIAADVGHQVQSNWSIGILVVGLLSILSIAVAIVGMVWKH
jgi:hypothetical protein